MTIRKFFWVLYGAFFILLTALGLMSRLLNLNKNVSIGLLILLSVIIVVVSPITTNRKTKVPRGV
jgi:hypothetical protein